MLAGEGLECILNGLYLTKADQLADHHMVVEHAQPHCASHEYYNGILDGRSKGVFHGRILVRQPAQKTDAKQTNKNLLLSEDATVKGAVKPDGSKKPFAQAFKTNGHTGKNSFKWSAKGLKPGKYVLRLQGTDPNGNKSSFTTTKFTVRKS